MSIAFYAPLKSPDDRVPSGDRTVGRALLSALRGCGFGAVEVASTLRSRDGAGDADAQQRMFDAAEAEIARLAAGPKPALWLTYHSYYKAPDLIGPALSRHWGIPYVLVEATRARKRLTGPWARFAEAAEAAADAARLVFYFTEHDRLALERDRPNGQALARLRPFLDRERSAPTPERPAEGAIRLLACAMLRAGDKLASYAALAAALALARCDWRLDIVGDGPERRAVEALFAPFGARATFHGAVDSGEVATHYRMADLLVWPGVGEAFGMVYLEAQAEGCACLAEDRPGVRDVVRDGGVLVARDQPALFADAIDRLAGDRAGLALLGRRGCAQVAADHLLGAARAKLSAAIAPLMTPR